MLRFLPEYWLWSAMEDTWDTWPVEVRRRRMRGDAVVRRAAELERERKERRRARWSSIAQWMTRQWRGTGR